MKRHLLALLLIILSIPLFSAPITKEITAYKYSVNDPFTSEDELLGIRFIGLNDEELPPNTTFNFDASDIGKTNLFCTYILYGNLKGDITLSTTFSPLRADTNTCAYTITMTPRHTKIGNATLPTTVDHGSYHFFYETTEPSAVTKLIKGTDVTINLSYPMSTTITPATAQSYAVIDHWTRTGNISINIPSEYNGSANPSANGTYRATITFEYTVGG